MRAWQGALLLPVGIALSGLGYMLYKRAGDLIGGAGPGGYSSNVAADSVASSPASRLFFPLQPHIAVVELYGPIHGGPKVSEYVNLLEGLRGNSRVRAVVLEVDSPGGSAPASDYLHRAVARLARQKPVIAFIRGIGASGAYMVSCGATKVVALPSAIVGSIGVISMYIVMKDLLKRMGIDMTVAKSGPFKDMGAFYREATEEEHEKQKELITEFHDQFVALVAESRHMKVEEVKKYATGEVYTGRKAKEHGLVDELGDMDTALALASEMGNVPRRVVYARPRRPLFQRLFSRFSASMAEEIGADLERRFGGYVYYQPGPR